VQKCRAQRIAVSVVAAQCQAATPARDNVVVAILLLHPLLPSALLKPSISILIIHIYSTAGRVTVVSYGHQRRFTITPTPNSTKEQRLQQWLRGMAERGKPDSQFM